MTSHARFVGFIGGAWTSSDPNLLQKPIHRDLCYKTHSGCKACPLIPLANSQLVPLHLFHKTARLCSLAIMDLSSLDLTKSHMNQKTMLSNGHWLLPIRAVTLPWKQVLAEASAFRSSDKVHHRKHCSEASRPEPLHTAVFGFF
jgi:hypothetical protein